MERSIPYIVVLKIIDQAQNTVPLSELNTHFLSTLIIIRTWTKYAFRYVYIFNQK